MSGRTKDKIAAILKELQHLEIHHEITSTDVNSKSIDFFLDEFLSVIKHLNDEKRALTRILTETGVELREYIEELSIVRSIGEHLDVTKEVNEIYNSVLEIILEELGAENTSIMILNKATQELELAVGKGKLPQEKSILKYKIKVGEGVAGLVAKTGEPILIADTSLDKRFIPFKKSKTEILSLLSLPFPTSGEIIGVINVSHPHANVFTANQLRVLIILANQIAVAVNNVNLFNQLKTSNEKLTNNEKKLKLKVTELTEMNENIQRIRFLNESIIENVQNGIFLVDNEGKIKTWNKWLEETCCIKRQQAINSNISEVFNKFCKIDVEESFEKSLTRKRGHIKKQVVIDINDEKNFWEFSFIPLKAKTQERQIIVVVNDVTAQKVKEEERLSFIQKLEGTNKHLQDLNKAKSEYVSMVSHELRIPLTVLKGYLSLLEGNRYGELNPVQQEKLNIMAQKVVDLNILIEELLDISIMESGLMVLKKSNFNVKGLIANLVQDFVALGHSVEFKCQNQKALKYFGDEEKIKQVINILIDNAIKFSLKNQNVQIGLSVDEKFCFIHVKDVGLGIKDSDKKKIFKKFYQGEKSKGIGHGAGLGLAIAKKIIIKHQGMIWAEDNAPQGTIIKVKLPIIEKKLD